ncbi:hypothetical protein EJ04DRAFT_399507, partial [Polyplosphaeria fusca]
IALRYAGLWPVVPKKTVRPIGTIADPNEAAIEAWDEKDNKALVMILSSVHTDLIMSVAMCDTSPAAWEHRRFDRDTGNTSVLLFRSLTNLRYKDGDDLRVHLDEFH